MKPSRQKPCRGFDPRNPTPAPLAYHVEHGEMSKEKKRRPKFHYEGVDEGDGSIVFTECVEDESLGATVVRARRMESGKPVPLGQSLGRIYEIEDGHYEIEETVPRFGSGKTRKGPIKVVTDSYRAGWEGIFGKNGIN